MRRRKQKEEDVRPRIVDSNKFSREETIGVSDKLGDVIPDLNSLGRSQRG